MARKRSRPTVIEEPPAIRLQMVGRLDMEEMARVLSPSQISAVIGGIAQMLAASQVRHDPDPFEGPGS
jgi:hypothetical protein